jgi:hypothetical protein
VEFAMADQLLLQLRRFSPLGREVLAHRMGCTEVKVVGLLARQIQDLRVEEHSRRYQLTPLGRRVANEVAARSGNPAIAAVSVGAFQASLLCG